MRTPPTLAALLVFLVCAVPAGAQVKTDLGASVSAGAGASAAASVSAQNGAGAPAPLIAPGLASALTSPSAGVVPSAPAALLAPAARPGSLSLPSSALAPATVLAPSAAASTPEAPKTPAASASAPAAPPGPPGSAAAAAAPPGAPPVPFVAALRKLGVPEDLTSRLLGFLAARHPGNQELVYHGQGHSFEVAGFTARVVEDQDLSPDRKILLIFAASLHDVDPERVPDTPARVSATLAHLDEDPQARALVAEFGSRYGFTSDQVKALIMATDFSMDPAEMKAKQDAFASAAQAAFPGEDFGLTWGRRLAFIDQSSTYLGGVETAKKRVEGLAHEIRSNLAALGKGGGPTDAQMLAGTAKFLSVLRSSPNYALLPADLRGQFETTQSYFAERQTPEAWAAAAAPAPARAPPDLAAAKRYVRSIAGGLALDEKQTDALLEQFFEEEGIPAGSPRAEAVRRELLPSKTAAEETSVAGLSPLLQPRRGVLLKIAAQRKTTPAAIEAALARRGVLKLIAGLPDATFERQADMVLNRDELERAVAGYPHGKQGDFMRSLANDMATPSGKSVEEVARDGVFAYVDFAGNSVARAGTGRDPDVGSAQVVFYVTRAGGRWRIGGYRQNRRTGRSDAELARSLKNWLISGGVPENDLE